MKINKKTFILVIFACLATQIGKASTTEGLINYLPSELHGVILNHAKPDGINPFAKTSKNFKENFKKPTPGFELRNIIDSDAQTNALKDIAHNEFNANVPGGEFYKSTNNQERYITKYLENFKQFLKCSHQYDIVLSPETGFSIKSLKTKLDEKISQKIKQFRKELKKFNNKDGAISSQIGNRTTTTKTLCDTNYSQWLYADDATLEQILQDLKKVDQTSILPRIITISNDLLKQLLKNIMDDFDKKSPNSFVPFLNRVLIQDRRKNTLFHMSCNKLTVGFEEGQCCSLEQVTLMLDANILGANYINGLHHKPYEFDNESIQFTSLFLNKRPFFLNFNDISLLPRLTLFIDEYESKFIIETFGLGKDSCFIKKDDRIAVVTSMTYSVDNADLLKALIESGINIFQKHIYGSNSNKPTLFQYYVCGFGYKKITQYFLSNHDLFLKGIRGVDNQNNTALHYACSTGDGNTFYNFESKKDIVQKILNEQLININVQNLDGDTPLHCALNMYLTQNVKNAHTIKEIINFLIQHEANIDIKNNENESPKEFAENNNMVDILDIFKEQECKEQAIRSQQERENFKKQLEVGITKQEQYSNEDKQKREKETKFIEEEFLKQEQKRAIQAQEKARREQEGIQIEQTIQAQQLARQRAREDRERQEQQKRTFIRNGIAFGIGALSINFIVKKFILPRLYKSKAA